MRVFIAGLATETNSFSPIPSGALAFSLDHVRRVRAGEIAPPKDEMLAVFHALCSAGGHEIVQSIAAGAEPGAPVVRAVYEELRDMILEDLRAAGAVDVVLLALHGAMIAQGYDDCEGDLLARIREIAPRAIIGAQLDPHCSLTEAMVAHADLITIMREYPHTDFAERAADLYRHCLRAARGDFRPAAALIDCRMIGFFPTTEGAMKQVVAAFRHSSADLRIVTAEFAHGFPWGDVPEMGARVLVYADGDLETAKAEALRLARLVHDRRRELQAAFPGLASSLDRAAGLDGLVVLGDFADNPGGGAPGDSTFVLRALLDRGIADAAIGAFYDPEAARLCADAGPGATIRLRLGGKLGPESGDPVDLVAEIVAVAKDHACTAFGMRVPLGRSAAIRCRGIDILIVSSRSQLYGADGFTGLGISLQDKRLVVVKSSNHYVASFGPLADHIWHVATPGAMTLDFASIPYRRLDRPVFPLVENPWADEDMQAAIRIAKRPASGGI
ncbi:MAG: M81 family peptidase [Paracoccus sp. BP8]|nr:MAG: M81 family peptidase [Paracoccus sp. BP8]